MTLSSVKYLTTCYKCTVYCVVFIRHANSHARSQVFYHMHFLFVFVSRLSLFCSCILFCFVCLWCYFLSGCDKISNGWCLKMYLWINTIHARCVFRTIFFVARLSVIWWVFVVQRFQKHKTVLRTIIRFYLKHFSLFLWRKKWIGIFQFKII